MIKSLSLENFQSHKSTTLEFNSGVNVIIGPSDSGKTAIIRALRWLIWNRPLGNAFRSNWSDESIVQIKTKSDTITLSLGKNNKKIYDLNEHGFEANGTDVPSEVSEALNISEINLQSQLDKPFLLSDSAGEVALHFNKIAKLEKINIGLVNIESWIREIVFTIGHDVIKDKPATGLIKDLKDKKTELESFQYLNEFEINIVKLEKQQTILDKKQIESDELTKLISKINQKEKEIEKASTILAIEKLLNSILSDIVEKQALETKQIKLKRLVKLISNNITEINSNKILLLYASNIDKTLNLIKDKASVIAKRDHLKKVLQNANSNITDLEHANIKYENLYIEFEDNFPDICPLCNK
jgi:DNA repair exonuclease SbcCD ATPase subunit